MTFKNLACSTTRAFSTVIRAKGVSKLPNGSPESFRELAFKPETPALLHREHLGEIPAASKWFLQDGASDAKLNIKYLETYGSLVIPLEITSTSAQQTTPEFARVESPLSDFLSFIDIQQHTSTSTTGGAKTTPVQIYLAQCSISSLPPALRADLSTPAFVTHAGRGDVYDSSIWLGLAPTYTSLHKDPNPNLFVQLVGRKIVRIFEPRVGAELFAEAQRRVGAQASASFRGEEMMHGEEKNVLEELVWRDALDEKDNTTARAELTAYEAVLDGGEGVFIPKGWWHSVKGVGHGIVGSANWWFR